MGHKKTKLNICHHMLTSSTQLQNRSFHVVERTRTSSKCQKLKNARAKRAKILFFIVKYDKYVGVLLPSSSWLLKLPTDCTAVTLIGTNVQMYPRSTRFLNLALQGRFTVALIWVKQLVSLRPWKYLPRLY